MPYRATARSINSPHKNMKNTLSIILLLCGIAQANAAYVVGDADFSLEDATAMVSGGSFAVSFDFGDQTLDSVPFSFRLAIGTGSDVPTPKSYYIQIENNVSGLLAMTSVDHTSPGYLSTTPEAHSIFMSNVSPFPTNATGPFIVQYLGATDGKNAHVTLSYVNNDTPIQCLDVELKDSHSLPSTIGYASLTILDSASDITTWTGVVTAEDIKNPQPAPSPAVPEPTTATLSLLALAGLAARRRRRG